MGAKNSILQTVAEKLPYEIRRGKTRARFGEPIVLPCGTLVMAELHWSPSKQAWKFPPKKQEPDGILVRDKSMLKQLIKQLEGRSG